MDDLLQENIRRYIAKFFGKDAVSDTDRLKEDLLSHEVDLIEISMFLEVTYSADEIEKEIVEAKTVGDIIQIVTEKTKS